MIGLFSKEKREAKLEAAIRKEMAAGLYHRALPYFLERQRYAEAAEIEVRRGRLEEAAKLYERAQSWSQAAECYVSVGELDAASVALTKGNKVDEAAELLRANHRAEDAARLFLDVGLRDQAAACYEEAGQLEMAAELYDALGDDKAATRVNAERALQERRFADAAELLEGMSEFERAADAWEKADEPGRAAILRAQDGNFEVAVEALLETGEFAAAAAMFADHGDLKRAAETAFRGGDMERAIGYLEDLGDFVTMAKVYLSYGRRDEAKKALERITEDAPDFELGFGKLAALQIEDVNTKAGYSALQRMVERRINAGGPFDEAVRGWVLEMVGLLVGHDKTKAAMACFDTLEQLSLMTPALEKKRTELGEALQGSKVTAAVAIESLDSASTPAPETAPQRARKLSTHLGFPESDRYQFIEKIGQGGNGAIYLAKDTVLDREVVIKMIINTQLPSELAKKWFFREAQVSAKLNHPNIVTVYDLSEIQGQPYIAMEYVDGVDLSDYLEDKVPLAPADALPLLRQFTDALQYAHKQNVVHRDIKLENVMITKGGTIKLMDFGLAKAIQGGTTTMVIAGTPAYMSPEQILGSKVDHRTDIYATGVMLFFMLTGQFPFSEGNILEAHRGQAIPDPRDLVPKMRAGFENIIFHAMAKKKEERYSQISDLFRDFERLAKSSL